MNFFPIYNFLILIDCELYLSLLTINDHDKNYFEWIDWYGFLMKRFSVYFEYFWCLGNYGMIISITVTMQTSIFTSGLRLYFLTNFDEINFVIPIILILPVINSSSIIFYLFKLKDPLLFIEEISWNLQIILLVYCFWKYVTLGCINSSWSLISHFFLFPALKYLHAKATGMQCVEIDAPSRIHRLIIGKKGANIREIQNSFPQVRFLKVLMLTLSSEMILCTFNCLYWNMKNQSFIGILALWIITCLTLVGKVDHLRWEWRLTHSHHSCVSYACVNGWLYVRVMLRSFKIIFIIARFQVNFWIWKFMGSTSDEIYHILFNYQKLPLASRFRMRNTGCVVHVNWAVLSLQINFVVYVFMVVLRNDSRGR